MPPSAQGFEGWASAPQLWVSTIGRRTGEWRDKWWLVFAVDGDTVYLLEEAGERADWVRNVRADPRVRVWVDGNDPVPALARIVDDPTEITRARAAVARTAMGSTLQDLIERGLPIAISPSCGSR